MNGHAKERLRQRIRATRRTGAIYTMSGGGASGVYWDVRSALLKPGALEDAVDVFRSTSADGVHTVAGMGVGGTLLVGALCAARPSVTGLVVRQGHKDHGLQRQVEGSAGPAGTVVLVDDVATTGSTLEALMAALLPDHTLFSAVVLLDRGEGARERMEACGVPFQSIFTKEDVS